jgi:hypothetical protein
MVTGRQNTRARGLKKVCVQRTGEQVLKEVSRCGIRTRSRTGCTVSGHGKLGAPGVQFSKEVMLGALIPCTQGVDSS